MARVRTGAAPDWTCSCDAVNPAAAAFCEACGKQRAGGGPRDSTGSGYAWNPPTPPVRELTGPRWVITDEQLAELAALRASWKRAPEGSL